MFTLKVLNILWGLFCAYSLAWLGLVFGLAPPEPLTELLLVCGTPRSCILFAGNIGLIAGVRHPSLYSLTLIGSYLGKRNAKNNILHRNGYPWNLNYVEPYRYRVSSFEW